MLTYAPPAYGISNGIFPAGFPDSVPAGPGRGPRRSSGCPLLPRPWQTPRFREGGPDCAQAACCCYDRARYFST